MTRNNSNVYSKVILTKQQLESILKIIDDVDDQKSKNLCNFLTFFLFKCLQSYAAFIYLVEFRSNRTDNHLSPASVSPRPFNRTSRRKTSSKTGSGVHDANDASDAILFVNFHNKSTMVDSNAKKQAQPSARLKRNQSLIELKREQWEEERKLQADSDIWYQKFDSFHPSLRRASSIGFALNSTKSSADLHSNADQRHISIKGVSEGSDICSLVDQCKTPYFQHQLATNAYFVPTERIALQRFNRSVSDVSTLDHQHQRSLKNQILSTCPSTPSLFAAHTPDELDSVSCLLNTTERNYRRYSRNNPEEQIQKRLKQIEYQNCLRLQLIEKEMNRKLIEQKEQLEEQRWEQRLKDQQKRLQEEFERDHQRQKPLHNIGKLDTIMVFRTLFRLLTFLCPPEAAKSNSLKSEDTKSNWATSNNVDGQNQKIVKSKNESEGGLNESTLNESISPMEVTPGAKDETVNSIRMPQKWIITDDIIVPATRSEKNSDFKRVSLESGLELSVKQRSARFESQKPKWSENGANTRSARTTRTATKG